MSGKKEKPMYTLRRDSDVPANATPLPDYPRFENRPEYAQWGFLWINSDHIWNGTPELFDKMVQTYADADITHIMTFGDIHFRWNYRRYFQRTNAALAQVVRAAHERGLRVVEHHSCDLFTSRGTEEERRAMLQQPPEKPFWPQFAEDYQLDSTVDGIPLADMIQYSGRTGEPLFSFYHAYAMCPNNPHFRKSYFAYLESLYALGIDGIMTDDVEFFDDDCCACVHCRNKFKAETGMELPETGDTAGWNHFLNDVESVRYLAWKRFRYQSCLDFHKAVVRHYQSLNLKMLRPNYIATAISWANPWAYVFDDLPELDWGFQEAFGGGMRYSYPEYTFEARHRSAICRHYKIPAMSLHYPATENNRLFAWGLSLYNNHKFLSGGKELPIEPEGRLRAFEKAHFSFLNGMSSHAKFAIWDSTANRELDGNYNTHGSRIMCGLAQCAIHGNIPIDVVQLPDAAILSNYRLIAVPETIFLSDAELIAIGNYLNTGGTVLMTTNSGSRNTDTFGYRSWATIASLLNLSEVPDLNIQTVQKIPAGKGKLILAPYEEFLAPSTERCMAWQRDKNGVSIRISEEKFHLLTPSEHQRRSEVAAQLEALVDDGLERIECPDAPLDLLFSAYFNDNQAVLHILNAVGTMEKMAGCDDFGYDDPVPFVPIDKKLELRLSLPGKLANHPEWKATLFRLDHEGLSLKTKQEGSVLRLTIPGGIIQNYALVEITR